MSTDMGVFATHRAYYISGFATFRVADPLRILVSLAQGQAGDLIGDHP
jgi:hypothetical protein